MTTAEMLALELLAAGDPHTFRDGSLLVTVGGFAANAETLTVNSVQATFLGEPVVIDAPYVFINAPGGTLADAHEMIAETVRHNGGL